MIRFPSIFSRQNYYYYLPTWHWCTRLFSSPDWSIFFFRLYPTQSLQEQECYNFRNGSGPNLEVQEEIGGRATTVSNLASAQPVTPTLKGTSASFASSVSNKMSNLFRMPNMSPSARSLKKSGFGARRAHNRLPWGCNIHGYGDGSWQVVTVVRRPPVFVTGLVFIRNRCPEAQHAYTVMKCYFPRHIFEALFIISRISRMTSCAHSWQLTWIRVPSHCDYLCSIEGPLF